MSNKLGAYTLRELASLPAVPASRLGRVAPRHGAHIYELIANASALCLQSMFTRATLDHVFGLGGSSAAHVFETNRSKIQEVAATIYFRGRRTTIAADDFNTAYSHPESSAHALLY